MNCPYCNRKIKGWTGLQELQNFHKHLPKCRKNPNNVVIKQADETVFINKQSLRDALDIRAESGQ